MERSGFGYRPTLKAKDTRPDAVFGRDSQPCAWSSGVAAAIARDQGVVGDHDHAPPLERAAFVLELPKGHTIWCNNIAMLRYAPSSGRGRSHSDDCLEVLIMTESSSHRRAKSKAAGRRGQKEIRLTGGRRLDALTPSGRATEVERSGNPKQLE